MKKLTAFTLLLFVCNQLYSQTDAFKWLVGTWKINNGATQIVEQWQQSNDSTFIGKSYFVKNSTDTIPQETIKLAYRNGSWYYIPTVKNQNNGQPVYFKLIFLKASEFISENPEHDFPQRIAYRRIGKQLFASIEGKRNGKYSKLNFDFTTE
jgi:Domain of unknown function (DUF6265)